MMLTKEIEHYQPTIMCWQEVDKEQYAPYFIKLLESCDYDHTFLAAKRKRQGLLIAWKRDQFELAHRKDIFYDLLDAGTVGPVIWTGNLALALGLRRRDRPGKGIWVSNTHLFWHPRGSYERMRQAGLLVSETVEFAKDESTWPIFICGGITRLIHLT
jgi:RNA exonuclease NGL2